MIHPVVLFEPQSATLAPATIRWGTIGHREQIAFLIAKNLFAKSVVRFLALRIYPTLIHTARNA
jgi:hypothetical protein